MLLLLLLLLLLLPVWVSSTVLRSRGYRRLLQGRTCWGLGPRQRRGPPFRRCGSETTFSACLPQTESLASFLSLLLAVAPWSSQDWIGDPPRDTTVAAGAAAAAAAAASAATAAAAAAAAATAEVEMAAAGWQPFPVLFLVESVRLVPHPSGIRACSGHVSSQDENDCQHPTLKRYTDVCRFPSR